MSPIHPAELSSIEVGYPDVFAELARLRDENARLREALKSARLMLYAYRGARLNMSLADDHKELNDVIRQAEDALKVSS